MHIHLNDECSSSKQHIVLEGQGDTRRGSSSLITAAAASGDWPHRQSGAGESRRRHSKRHREGFILAFAHRQIATPRFECP
ncbi:hypothetical protein SKAU_G00352020 [Synaphobranchus kaupii]|uniref:Uncharacterized protein n=1 Tax=Synaphobranchus kaupii TaxID=118154 RepID=A0A9Q1EKR2_SYNKA|nr:hypothetical protein SKAU_G00352020 [Synaphobranchus kaupii]